MSLAPLAGPFEDTARDAPQDDAPPQRSDGSSGSDRLRALVEVVLCSGFPTQLLVMALLAMAGVSPVVSTGRLSMTYVTVLSLADTALLVPLILWLVRRGGESPRELFVGHRPARLEARLGALLIPVVLAIVATAFVLVDRFAPWLHNVPQNPLEGLIETPGDAVVFALVVITAGGIREELQRAFVLRRFEQHLGGGLVGLVLFSLAFGAGHVIQGWDAALITGLLGAFWGAIYLWRRSVVAPMVSHSGFNVLEVLRHAVQI